MRDTALEMLEELRQEGRQPHGWLRELLIDLQLEESDEE